MKPIWIDLVNTGVANRFELEDHVLIEMNWRLTLYPKLYRNVFEHEMQHNMGKFKTKDLVHDMKTRTPGLFKFMRKHVSSWTQLLPIYWDRKRKTLVYDWSSIVSWWLLFGTAYVVYYIIGLVRFVINRGGIL